MNLKLLALSCAALVGLGLSSLTIGNMTVFHDKRMPPKEITIVSSEGEAHETDVNLLIVALKPETTVFGYIFSPVGPAQEVLTSAGVNAYSGYPGDNAQVEAQENAWNAASLLAGKRTGAIITEAPQDYALKAGDIIMNNDGRVTLSGKLSRNFYPRIKPTTALTVLREGKKVKVTVPSNNFLMIADGSLKFKVFAKEPNDTSIPELTSISGGSSGLPLFVAYYEYLSGEDVTRDDKNIAATGTIKPDFYGGYSVGPIGSLNIKIEEAIDAGMDIILVPSSQEIEAREYAAGRAKIIPVDSASDALAKLREDYTSGFCTTLQQF